MRPGPAADRGVDPLDLIVEEYLEAYRAGSRPTPSEYARRHPDLAERILSLFPALIDVEQAIPPPPRSRRDKAPVKIGEDTIIRTIGAGGMGVVYEAVQESLGRHIALKVLPGGGDLALKRFRREARTAALLHHSNIVPVFAIGESEGIHYYAMQYIRGQGLDRFLVEAVRRKGQPGPDLLAPDTAARPRPNQVTGADQGSGRQACPATEPLVPEGSSYYREVARIVMKASEALACAHAQGVLHRDVKPSNILIDERRNPWLTDFGLAKGDDASDLTATGDLVGTLRYMAPERFRDRCDARSDVFSLGATLYEMLTLRPAYQAIDRMDLIAQIGRGDPIRPRKVDQEIPRDLETVVQKAMAHEPSDRYATASELAEDLGRFLSDRAVRARRANPVEQIIRWWRRNPAVATLTASVSLLLVALTLGSFRYGLEMGHARDKALALEANVVESKEALGAQLVRSLRDNARAERFSRRIGQRFETLRLVSRAAEFGHRSGEPEAFFDDLRSQAVAALALPDIRRVGDLPPENSLKGADRTDAAMTRVATVESGGRIIVRRIADGQVLARLDGFRGGQHVRLSADGRMVATRAASGSLRVWDLGEGRASVAWEESSGVMAHELRPDGRELAESMANGSVVLLDLLDTHSTRKLNSRRPAWDLAYSPRGRSIAMVGAGAVEVIDLESGRSIADLRRPGGVDSIAWHPDGRRMAVACDNGRILLWDVEAATTIHSLPGRSGGMRVSFSPDGDLLVGQGWDGVLRLFDPFSSQRMASSALWEGRVGIDGRMAVDAWDRGPSIGELATCEAYHALQPPDPRTDRIGEIAIHPDGRLLACGVGSAIKIWDLATGRVVASLPTRAQHVSFTGSGELLAQGRDGVVRWPFREASRGRIVIGPPALIMGVESGGSTSITANEDGRLLGMIAEDGPIVIDTAHPDRRLLLGPREDVRRVAVSPDGRWAAVGSWDSGGGVSIYEAAGGRPVHHIPGDGQAFATFSPDRRWLAISGNPGPARLLETGSWQPGPVLGSTQLAFSSVEDQVVVASGNGAVRLLRTSTGEELARFEAPGPEEIGQLALTPDGSRMVVVSPAQNAIYCWDLRSVRRGHAALGLDWKSATLPDEPARTPLSIQVVNEALADPSIVSALQIDACDLAERVGLHVPAIHVLRCEAFRSIGEDRKAMAELDRAAEHHPGEPAIQERRGKILMESRLDYRGAHASYARAASLGSERLEVRSGLAEGLSALGRWSEAVEAYSAVLARRPWDAASRNGRGRALRRLGREAEAILDFTAAIESAPSDLLPRIWRAACHETLGETDLALQDRAMGIERLFPETANAAAWLLVTGPPSTRDPALALDLAHRAVILEPRLPAHRNTLGLVCLRLGRDREALAGFDASLLAGEPHDEPFDRYPRAVILDRLGRRDEAWKELIRSMYFHLGYAHGRRPREKAELREVLVESLLGLLHPVDRTRQRPGEGAFRR